ncbi:MAG: hypothetical protein A2537_01225 [Candidatus Magasanikbacteria bacterium RIFOXYD2_FULL_36_9]|uniref:Nudix hydrolase domain-containing protein n=1 Tax=Candidatus Magasanikbacteria bacterium RIFOXYD2_FULL_36_9 TaxID=1798707 RepID=A0A1F6NZC9_9BACT|nr:MAG: hypothetical protein A2537_01225 [Candidatus Magasanikbacteria bacterium RIFOXYD2_FULL_36_9]
MKNDDKKIYLGVYGIFIQNEKILVIKKARGPYTGQYDLPGGGLNFDENVEDALKREFVEETNAVIKETNLIGINEYRCQYKKEDGKMKDFHHLGIYYKVDITVENLKTSPDGQDSNGALFVDIKDLNSKNTSPIAFGMILKAYTLSSTTKSTTENN